MAAFAAIVGEFLGHRDDDRGGSEAGGQVVDGDRFGGGWYPEAGSHARDPGVQPAPFGQCTFADAGLDQFGQREFLSASAGLAGLLTLPPQLEHLAAGRRIGTAMPGLLRQRLARLRRLDDYLGGTDTYRLYLAELQATQTLAAQATTGHPAACLAESACETAGKAAPPRVRALLNERRAWAIAQDGDQGEIPARRALDIAAAALSNASTTPSPDWASWIDETELQIMTGRCLTRLNRPHEAITVLRAALGGFDDRQARDKALYLTWLAEACIATGDIEQGAAVTGQVISLANGVASARPGQRVAFLLRRLSDCASAPYVTELADRAAGITPATWRE